MRQYETQCTEKGNGPPRCGPHRAAEDLNRTKRQAGMPSAWGLELDLGLFWPFKAD